MWAQHGFQSPAAGLRCPQPSADQTQPARFCLGIRATGLQAARRSTIRLGQITSSELQRLGVAARAASLSAIGSAIPGTSGNNTFALKGVLAALVTPFTDALKIDYSALKKQLEFLRGSGITEVVVNGTSGEFPSLTLDERMQLAEEVRANWPGTVVNNVSATSTGDAISLLRHSQQQHGGRTIADAVLLLPPYYFAGCTDAGIEAWLATVMQESSLPVYIYNFPAHTGNLVSPEVYARLADAFPLMRGIKNTFNDLPLALKFKDAVPASQARAGSIYTVLLGYDPGALEGLEAGLDGSIAIGGNYLPEAFLTLRDAFLSGEQEKAAQQLRRISAWCDSVADSGLTDPAGAKVAMGAKVPGFKTLVRPPLVAASEDQAQTLASQFTNL